MKTVIAHAQRKVDSLWLVEQGKEVSDTETTTKNTHTVKEGMNEWVLSVSVSDVNFGMLFFVELVHT